MRLREIARLTSSPSAKLLFSSCNVTAPTRTTPMSSVLRSLTTTTTKAATKNKNFSSRRPTTFSFKQKRTSSRSFSLTTRAMGAKVGDQISGVLQLGPWIDGMPTPVNMAERCKGKKVILVGLPGASCFLSSPKINTTRDRSAADSFVGNYSLLLLRKVFFSIIINT